MCFQIKWYLSHLPSLYIDSGELLTTFFIHLYIINYFFPNPNLGFLIGAIGKSFNVQTSLTSK